MHAADVRIFLRFLPYSDLIHITNHIILLPHDHPFYFGFKLKPLKAFVELFEPFLILLFRKCAFLHQLPLLSLGLEELNVSESCDAAHVKVEVPPK